MRMRRYQNLRTQAAFLMILGAASVPTLAAVPAVTAGGAAGSMEPTGGADSAALARALGGCDGIRIDVMTDGFPGETRWELKDHITETLVAEERNFSSPNTLHTSCVLGVGCFDFTIFDLGGDGICCDFGEGFYEVYYFDVLVAEGGIFDSSETASAVGACDFSDFTVEAPGFWTGSSCGSNDCSLKSSDEVMFEVIIPQDGTWTFSLCGSSYDTILFVGTSVCREDVGSDDDTCGLQSELTADLPAGTYFVTLEGFSGCGDYELTITGSCICGDGVCEASCGEHCGSCSEDCGSFDCLCDTTVIATYPNCNGFENGLGDWVQSSCGDIDWTRHSGPTHTPPIGTGPNAAHGGSFYVYANSFPTGVGNPNKTTILQACFDFSALSDPKLDFWYHMLGATMGSLRVDVSDDDCGTWTEVWFISENQGSDWHEALVDLSEYAGSIATVRFVATTGTWITSDIAIDDICMRGTPVLCPVGTAMTFARNGMTDAGQPHPIDDAATAQGFQMFTASGPPNAADPSCWKFSDTNAGNCGNRITNVTETTAGNYAITLLRPLQARSVTTITYDWPAGSTSGVFTALPGDANGSGQTNAVDIGKVIDCLTTGGCEAWKCDIDRLGGCTGADLERLIDLLNDAGQYNGWEGATPASANCPAI